MKQNAFPFALLLSFMCFAHVVAAQSVIQINFEKIKQKKIRQLIERNHLQRANEMELVTPECLDAHSECNIHEKQFIIHGTIDEVWKAYQTISPKKAWSGDMASFGVMYEHTNRCFHYIGEQSPRNEVGQVIFINLKMLKGLFQLAVAHKIVEINEAEHLIRSCYLKTGKSKGTQYITMNALPDGTTRVRHITYYKSNSKFRDKHLYPFLHGKVITEFHRNISHVVLQNQQKKKEKSKMLASNQ